MKISDIILAILLLALAPTGYHFGWREHERQCKIIHSEKGITDEASTEAESAREGYSFDDLLDAIEWVESKGIATAIGKNGEVGAYQIKDIYLDDYVRITEDDWFVDHPNDMRLEKWFSRKVTEAVIKHYAHVTWPNLDINDIQFIETAARSHKCPPERTKESTKPYWEKVKNRLERKVR